MFDKAIIFVHQSNAHRERHKRKTGNDGKMFYAIQKYPNKGSQFFDRHPETGSEFETREQLESGILAWRSRVTPSMAESIVFEIHQD